MASRPANSFEVRRLETQDIASYRELCLEGLKNHPEAFATSWEDEADKPVSWWAGRLESNAVFGGFVDGASLAGVAGLWVPDGVKVRHKGVLWGMYICPAARGTGRATALVQAVVVHVRTRVEEICLTVVSSNPAARRLYVAAGFSEYGLDRRALKVGGAYYDEVLMVLPLRAMP